MNILQNPLPQPEFLPMTPKELKKCGIIQPDIILVSGDAYVDHPSFATALIGRTLWDAGFTVGVIAQPDWTDHNLKSFKRLGKTRLRRPAGQRLHTGTEKNGQRTVTRPAANSPAWNTQP